jgi:hypothetical protein
VFRAADRGGLTDSGRGVGGGVSEAGGDFREEDLGQAGGDLGQKCLIISDFGVTMMSTRIDNQGGAVMATTTEKLTSEIQSLTDMEKLHLVDTILADLDRPDPELDRIWAEESRKRWAAYKKGRIPSVSYQDVMDKYHRV